MSRGEARKVFFSGSAVILGGSLSKPEPEDIEAPTSLSLGPTGGSSETRMGSYHFSEIVTFASARAKVIGNHDAASGKLHTLSTVTITGLDVLGMITADAVVARIAATTDRDGVTQANIRGSHFVNLIIDGEPQSVELAQSAPEGKLDGLMEPIKPERTRIFRADKNGLYIEKFGTVYLGELLPDKYAPRLTMVRLELGCAVEGEMSMGVVEGGGRPWP